MKVVDIVALNQSKEIALKCLELFFEDCIERNKDQISHSIKSRGKNETPRGIILLYVDYLLSHGISQYNRDMLIELVASGVIFDARELFIERMMNDPMINETLDTLIKNDTGLLIG